MGEMSIRDGGSLSYLIEEYNPTAEELANDHAMDISGSIFARMEEMGITQSELAKRLDMDESQVSRIIRGKRNITLKTLAKIEIALDFRLDEGFTYMPEKREGEAVYTCSPVPSSHSQGTVILNLQRMTPAIGMRRIAA